MEKIQQIISGEEIQKRAAEIGEQITKDLNGESAVMICILKGGVMFGIDIARNIKSDVGLEFAELSSYKNETESSGKISIIKDISCPIEGKNVIIAEDIIDTGRTLSFYIDKLRKRKPKSIILCVLIDKKERRIFNIKADYTGFETNGGFLVGYGLDYAQKYRNLNFIGKLKLL